MIVICCIVHRCKCRLLRSRAYELLRIGISFWWLGGSRRLPNENPAPHSWVLLFLVQNEIGAHFTTTGMPDIEGHIKNPTNNVWSERQCGVQNKNAKPNSNENEGRVQIAPNSNKYCSRKKYACLYWIKETKSYFFAAFVLHASTASRSYGKTKLLSKFVEYLKSYKTTELTANQTISISFRIDW